MNFEKCPNCDPGKWKPIDPAQLRRELAGTYQKPDEAIDMILKYNGVANTATASYRRGVPVGPGKDWATCLPRHRQKP